MDSASTVKCPDTGDGAAARQPGADGRAINTMLVRRMRIDTCQEPVLYMRGDCPICRAEGFAAMSRVEVRYQGRRVIATLNVVGDGRLLHESEVGLSEAAWLVLGAPDGAGVTLAHPQPVHSFSHVRAKLFGKPLSQQAATEIMRDVVAGEYSDIEIAAFLAACAARRPSLEEMTVLTRAMVETGERIDWGTHPVVDKHCVGGLPGNRTTLLVVPIVAACGLVMPKTSSRAITSPAGTADTMETLAPVSLDLARMRRVVEQEGGCVAWGGAVNLSPADDLLIRIERPLDIDSDSQLVASVLSKKIAAGSSQTLSGFENLSGSSFNDTLTGDNGPDVFVFGPGHDRVTDFDNTDQIQVGGVFTSFAQVMGHAAQQGADVVITSDAGDSIRLVGMSLSSLNAGDFLFG